MWPDPSPSRTFSGRFKMAAADPVSSSWGLTIIIIIIIIMNYGKDIFEHVSDDYVNNNAAATTTTTTMKTTTNTNNNINNSTDIESC